MSAPEPIPPRGDPQSGRQGLAYPGFARFAWFVFAYILCVILYGAWVRITGSGAGCGEHWPTCNGEIIPFSPSEKTVVEYTHRVTSGVLGPLVLGLFGWAWFGAGRRRVIRWLAGITLVFVLFEGMIGAGLVLGALVADDASAARAAVVALHLGNTLVLTACSALTAWFGAGRAWPLLGRAFEGRAWLWAGCAGLIVVSMTGAVTALGDTLFPFETHVQAGMLTHLGQGFLPDVHFLVRLRVLHPVLALGVGFGMLHLVQRWTDEPGELGVNARWSAKLLWLQLTLGGINILTAAPGWMQLVHLLAGELLWASLVLLLMSAQARAR